MRRIKKREEPPELRNWRARNQADPQGGGINYGYEALRQDENVRLALLRGLVNEQGGLCAYTGMRITTETCHVEHLRPQVHCQAGEDVAYTNLVACWPWPNCGFQAGFGAHAKGHWPTPEEERLFVSPLNEACTQRFVFDRRGEITAANPSDEPATKTIEKLNLDEHRERAAGKQRRLVAYRQQAISGVLGKYQELRLKDARTRLRQMDREEADLDQGADITLAPFSFVVRQALVRHIKKIEAIREQRP